MPASSNTNQDGLEDGVQAQRTKLQKGLTKEKVRIVTNQAKPTQNFTFKRNMNEKAVRIEFFLMEEDDIFLSLPLRKRMSQIIQNSPEELKDIYYEKGITGELPESCNDFKKFVV